MEGRLVIEALKTELHEIFDRLQARCKLIAGVVLVFGAKPVVFDSLLPLGLPLPKARYLCRLLLS